MNITWATPKPTRSFIPKLRRAASQRTINIALTVWKGAVDRTPVASGELRASWTLSAGRPDFTTVGEAGSAASDTSGALPKPSPPTLKPTILSQAKYFIANGKDYASIVEFGSTTIRPHLMLTRSVQAVDV